MATETYVNVRKNKFTQVSNGVLWDKDVTLQAKGLLSIFLSNSDDWELNIKEIITRSKNGRDAHYKIIDELIQHGYFARVELRNDKKQFERMVYIFSDEKEDVIEGVKQFAENPLAFVNQDKKGSKSVDSVDNQPFPESQYTGNSSEKPFPENQDSGIQDSGNADTENQYTNNNNLNYTKENNTKSNNTINQSYLQEIDNMFETKELPVNVLRVLSKNKDRLIDLQLMPIDILSFYKSSDNTVNDNDFTEILNRAVKNDIKNFASYMKTAIANWYKEYNAMLMPTDIEEEEGSYYKIPENSDTPLYDWLEEIK